MTVTAKWKITLEFELEDDGPGSKKTTKVESTAEWSDDGGRAPSKALEASGATLTSEDHQSLLEAFDDEPVTT